MEASNVSDGVKVRLVLVPVDGSKSAERSAKIAFQLAHAYGAKVIVLSVIASPGFSFSGPAGAPADLTEYYKLGTSEAKKAVESSLALAKGAGVDARGEVIEPVSSTVGAIVEFAEKEKVDLIVMGTRGLGGFKKLLLGSVSTGVVSHAHCSVLVIREAGSAQASSST
jgi:nucleotide-binding universal stress UspA family protein